MRKIDNLDVLKDKVYEAADVINNGFDSDSSYYCDYTSLFDLDIDKYFMDNPYSASHWTNMIDNLLTIIKHYKVENDRLERLYDAMN